MAEDHGSGFARYAKPTRRDEFLKAMDALVPWSALCEEIAPFYLWRRKFGGMDVPDAKRLKALEVENAKLKKMLAEAMLDIEGLKVVARGKF